MKIKYCLHLTADMPQYNQETYSNNITDILNNGICHMDIFKIVPLFKICDGYASSLYLEPFQQVCRVWCCLVDIVMQRVVFCQVPT
jgi:hypothetical protein